MSTNLFRWDLVERDAPLGARLTVREADAGRHRDVLIAVDSTGRRSVLLAIPSNERGQLTERASKGIVVQTVELRTDSHGLARFVEILCLEVEGHAALDTIASELLDALAAGATIGRIRLVQSVIAKWRRFWSAATQGLLSNDQQIGLWGELWFLSRWLAPAGTVAEAVSLWRGPSGSRHDFESAGFGIEVKSTRRIDGAHVVNGLEQLVEPLDGRLLLLSLQVREEPSGETSLPSVVADVRTAIGSDYATLDTFEVMLWSAGYDDRLEAEYQKTSLRVRSQALYSVSGAFPRLVPSHIVGGTVPSGVSNVTYEIRLDSSSPGLVASDPEGARLILGEVHKTA